MTPGCICHDLHEQHRIEQAKLGIPEHDPCSVRCPSCCLATWGGAR